MAGYTWPTGLWVCVPLCLATSLPECFLEGFQGGRLVKGPTVLALAQHRHPGTRSFRSLGFLTAGIFAAQKHQALQGPRGMDGIWAHEKGGSYIS